MSSIVQTLYDRNVVKMPSYVSATQYEVITGSYAYGMSDDLSDEDIYAFCIPPKYIVFPHEKGFINGFDDNLAEKFEQFSEHHIHYQEREYDITVFNIVKYFALCKECNPNMLDTLYVPMRCIRHSTKIGDMVRGERNVFLHKGLKHKFHGYAFSQLSKVKNKYISKLISYMREKNFDITADTVLDIISSYKKGGDMSNYRKLIENDEVKDALSKVTETPNKKRLQYVIDYGFDVKYASHIVRLLDEAEQLLSDGYMDLERNKEELKAIRRGEVSLDRIEEKFKLKEQMIEKLYVESKAIPHKSDTVAVKDLLMRCLEEFYGSIDQIKKYTDNAEFILRQIKKLVENY